MPARPVRSVVCAVSIAIAAAACGGGGGGGGGNAATPTTSVPSTTATTAPSAQLHANTAPWTLAAPVANEVLLTDGRQLLLLGGLDASKSSTAAVVRVDPSTGSSTAAGSLREAVHDSSGVLLSTGALVIGGGGPSENGTADAQVVASSGASTVAGKMPEPRSDHVAAAVGGKVYVLAGYDGSKIVSGVVSTVDGSSFTAVGTLPVPVRYPAVAVVGKSIYLFGGVASTQGTDTASIQRLDTATGAIDIVGQLPTTLSHASAIVLSGQVFLLGGYLNSTQLSDQILRIDPSTSVATIVGRLPVPNSDAAAVVIGGRGYLVGGKSTARNPLNSVVTLSLS
jgi:hypothetical protein